MQKYSKTWLIAAAILLLALAGCGGGGSTVSTGSITATSTKISGVAAEGIIFPGTVNIYALFTDGTKGGLLASAPTNQQGAYSADIGAYTGPVLVEATGTYTDEATQRNVVITSIAPLRAALANATGTINISVTPLTELAVQSAGSLTPAAITAANALVSDLFKLDIIGARPVNFDLNSLNGATTQAAKDYTLALAAISQMAKSSSSSQVIADLKTDISAGTMSSAAANSFTSALAAIMGQTQISSTTTLNLWSVGTKKTVLKLAVNGSAALIGGINVTITVPPGISLPTNQDTSVLDGFLIPTGTATGTKFFQASFATPGILKIAMASTSGFNAGEIVQLNLNLAAGTAEPGPELYKISDFTAVDTTTNPMSGLTAVLTK